MEHPAVEHPIAEHPAGEHPAGEHPAVEHPAGEHRAVAVSRPRLRGRLHQVALFVAVPAGLLLVLRAHGAAARAGAAVYALTLVGLFGISSAYHVHTWGPLARRRMKRLDHSMIFVFIAGTYTPFCLLVVRGVMGGVLLVAAWAVAGVGVSLHLCRPVPPRRVNGLYLGLGWLAVAGLPQILLNASTPVVTLLVTGGLIYTVGAVIFSARWPDPIPRVFGYHEVWHCMVVGACACHYAMLWLLVR